MMAPAAFSFRLVLLVLLLWQGALMVVVGGHPIRAKVLYHPSPADQRQRGPENGGGDGKYSLELVNSAGGDAANFWRPEHRGSVVAAKAEYSEDSDHPSGFGTFRVSTNGHMKDNIQAFAAGYAEGALTSTRILQHYRNVRCQVDCSGAVPEPISTFFHRQRAWTEQQVAAHPDCPRWKNIAATLAQFDGMLAGYNENRKEEEEEEEEEGPLDRWALDMINGLGDLFDIKPAVMRETRPVFEEMSREEMDDYMYNNSHCSAIIRVTSDLSDILVGHSSWFIFSSMLRIFKLYELNFHHDSNGGVVSSSPPGGAVAFSSYPGALVSMDDFYMMQGSRMVMVQTTNPILNASLWDLVVPESLLAWQRVKMANTLANNGSQWLDLVSMHNSGTYNNQYMIIDYKRFQPGQALPPHTLTVVEQIPGLVVGMDLTSELERAYFPSFNVPYNTQIYEESGFPRLDRLRGGGGGTVVGSEYQLAPRANIFRRDHSDVNDIESLKKILRYNDYEHDPLSKGSPINAICSRGDLMPGKPRYSGCYDTKVTNRELFLGGLKAWAINGPTSQGQPVFRWSDASSSSSSPGGALPPHEGQPDAFDFTFELMDLLQQTS